MGRTAIRALGLRKIFCATPTQGDAVSTSNLVLGRLALLRGNAPQAETFLLRSVPHNPESQSVIIGPNMTLALELLKQKRSETVLRFIEEWSRVSHGSTKEKLEEWYVAVRNGQIPDFGVNLLF